MLNFTWSRKGQVSQVNAYYSDRSFLNLNLDSMGSKEKSSFDKKKTFWIKEIQ